MPYAHVAALASLASLASFASLSHARDTRPNHALTHQSPTHVPNTHSLVVPHFHSPRSRDAPASAPVAATFGVQIMNSKQTALSCAVHYTPPSAAATIYDAQVDCGHQDTFKLVSGEKKAELRLFSDWTFLEAFFAGVRAVSVLSDSKRKPAQPASGTQPAPSTTCFSHNLLPAQPASAPLGSAVGLLE